MIAVCTVTFPMYQVTEGLVKSDCGPPMSNFFDQQQEKYLNQRIVLSHPFQKKATPPHQQNNNK